LGVHCIDIAVVEKNNSHKIKGYPIAEMMECVLKRRVGSCLYVVNSSAPHTIHSESERYVFGKR
jgi:hypothetical protein